MRPESGGDASTCEGLEGAEPVAVPQSEFFRLAFDSGTLQAICAIRERLLATESLADEVVLLRAAMLGVLHGPANKSLATQSYLSNQMPRTCAYKPDYLVRYWTAQGLSPPVVDVLSVLRRKLARLAPLLVPHGASVGNVVQGDSRLDETLASSQRDFSIVVTSPPYYGMRTYLEDQWLRHWFLGGPERIAYGQASQLAHAGQDAFAKSLGAVWRNVAGTKSPDLDLYIRFGVLPSLKVDARSLLRAALEESGVAWRERSVRPAETASSGRRQALRMTAKSEADLEFDFHVQRA